MTISNSTADLTVEVRLTTTNTIALFEATEGSKIRVTDGLIRTRTPDIFGYDWDFATIGIGGLSEQFNKIFRHAFTSRL